jgi:hypothetical protein
MTTFTTEDRLQAEAIREVVRDQCPCDGCEHAPKCKQHEWACRSFAKYVLDNYYYKDAARDPCRGTFNKVFHQKDDEILKNYVRAFKETGFEDQPEDHKEE